MKRYILPVIVAVALWTACGGGDKNETGDKKAEQKDTVYTQEPVVYPITRTDTITTDYFGTVVADPYRWLEIDTAAEVKDWVKEQNKVTYSYLEKIPFREKFKKRLEEIYNYPRVSAPTKVGDYYFYYKNSGLQNQAVIYYKKGENGKEEVFLDPNAMSEAGTASIGLVGFSSDDKYAVYSRSDAGSDWQEFRVIDIATKTEMPDVLKWVKFSGAEWLGNGFFYSRYPTPTKGNEFSATNQYHKVYYHKMGDKQEKDVLVFEDKKHPLRYHYVDLTEDEKYLIL